VAALGPGPEGNGDVHGSAEAPIEAEPDQPAEGANGDGATS